MRFLLGMGVLKIGPLVLLVALLPDPDPDQPIMRARVLECVKRANRPGWSEKFAPK